MRINKVIKETWEQHPDWQEKFWQFMRFGIVGTISSAIHYGVYCLVLLVANPTLSFTAGYAVGFVCNYFLNYILYIPFQAFIAQRCRVWL